MTQFHCFLHTSGFILLSQAFSLSKYKKTLQKIEIPYFRRFPRHLLNFETVRRGDYFKVRNIKILNIKTLSIFFQNKNET